MEPNVEYLPDSSIDDDLDRELRGLLTTCFTKTQDVVFKERRYFVEPYPHRWVIRNERGALVAHIGVHEKRVETEEGTFRVGGIAEVCVHPDLRGRGYVTKMLRTIHEWLPEHGFTFALLFGSPTVYSSSGYVEVNNLSYGDPEKGWKPIKGMVCELSETTWPVGEVHLPGQTF